MDAAESRRAASSTPKESEGDMHLRFERESIELSRGRILRELEAATHPRHREQLSAALAFLDEQLSKIDLKRSS